MNEERFIFASKLQDEGKLAQAVDEFLAVARETHDPIDKAGALINAATTLRALNQFQRAGEVLEEIGKLVAYAKANVADEPAEAEKISWLEVVSQLEQADLISQSKGAQYGLELFEKLGVRYSRELQEPYLRDRYLYLVIRKGILLTDVGRCAEALQFFTEADSLDQEENGVVKYYLGHCYLSLKDYRLAEKALTTALRVKLQPDLEARAHCLLGRTWNMMGRYSQAKLELERCAAMADEEFIKVSDLWIWLENCCRHLGLCEEASRYAVLSKHSG